MARNPLPQKLSTGITGSTKLNYRVVVKKMILGPIFLQCLCGCASHAHADSLEAARQAHSESIAQSTHQMDISQYNMTNIPDFIDIQDYINISNNKDSLKLDNIIKRLQVRYDFVSGWVHELESDDVALISYRELYWYYIGCKETLEDVSELLNQLNN